MAGLDRWVEGEVPLLRSDVCLADVVRWKVSHFLDSSAVAWDRRKILQSFAMPYCFKILAMELPAVREEDFLVWSGTQSGLYSVKSGYAFLQGKSSAWVEAQEGHHHSRLGFFKFLWALSLPPKWKIFVWRILHQGLADKTTLGRRGIVSDGLCGWCMSGEEDLFHIFRGCRLAVSVWRDGLLQLSFVNADPIPVQDWIIACIRLFASQDGRHDEKIPLFVATLWALWEARNELLFRGERWSKEEVLRRVGLAMDFWFRFVSGLEDGPFMRSAMILDGPLTPPGFHFCQLSGDHTASTDVTIQVDGA